MATSVQIPTAAADAITRLQTWLASSEGKAWAATYAVCLALLEIGLVEAGQTCLKKTNLELAARLTADGRRITNFIESELESLVSELEYIYQAIGTGELLYTDAITALLELGVQYQGAQSEPAVQDFVGQFLQPSNFLGGNNVAGFPTVTPPSVCTTGSSQKKGLCCTAITQLGLNVAAQGFTYVDCKGRTRCAACGTKPTTSTRKPAGTVVFDFKRIACGPSGCPSLVQAPIVPAV